MASETQAPPPAADTLSPDAPLLWHRELLLALLIGLVPMTVAVVFALTWPGFALIEDDGLSHYQPALHESMSRLLSGELPLWSDHTGCGFPLLARSTAYYPLFLLAHAFCSLVGLAEKEVAVTLVIHLGLAAFAAFVYLRYLRVSRPAAAVAAVAYALAGPMLGMNTNWSSFCALTAYIPLGFLVVEHVIAGDRSWFWPCLGGLVGGLVYLSGGPLEILKYSILFGAYFLACCRWETLLQSIVRLSVAGVLGLGSCLGAVLIQMEYLHLSIRYAAEGLGIGEAIVAHACPPEFYRGFFYPLTEFEWPIPHMSFWPRFPGGALFAGPLAPLAVGVAAVHFVSHSGRHRALLGLLTVYFLLSLGYFFEPNLLLLGVPVLGQHRWPVRWTVEFTALAALLSGVALDLAWRTRESPRTRAAVIAYLGLIGVAVFFRTGLSTRPELVTSFAGLAWVLAAVLLVHRFQSGSQRGFFAAAFVLTLIALVVNIPVVQRNRFAIMAPMYDAPLALDDAGYERVLYLSSAAAQRGHGEGNYCYNLPHAFGGRTVLTYGPFRLRTQEWADGLTTQGDIYDEKAVIHAFLQGHLLDTLRVRYVAVPRGNEGLNEACRANPDLRLHHQGEWVTIYRNDGFRAAAFPVRQVLTEDKLRSLNELGEKPLAQDCYVDRSYDGPSTFDGQGRVSDFHENHGTISCVVEADTPQFVVVTDTWYPGWQATLDGQSIPLYRVNSSFLGVSVPAGRHEVRLFYWPTKLVWLTLLSSAFGAVLFLFCGVAIVHRLWREVAAAQPTEKDGQTA